MVTCLLSKDKNEGRKRHNEETLPLATNHKTLWDSSDDVIVEELVNKETTIGLALYLGRTYQAIQHRRTKLKVAKRRAAVESKGVKPKTFDETLKEWSRLTDNGTNITHHMKYVGNNSYIIVPAKRASEVLKNGS